jgi:hypothetical protein
MTVLDLVSMIELKSTLAGIVTKNKAFMKMKTMKNPNNHMCSLIATSWLSGYESNVVKTYIRKMAFGSYP